MQPSKAPGYDAIRESLAYHRQTALTLIALRGPDARSFLHRMLTNAVDALAAGEGCYALLLDDKGKVTADMRVLCIGDTLHLVVDTARADETIMRLDKFIIMDDVTLAEIPVLALTVVGPKTADILQSECGIALPEPEYQHSGNIEAGLCIATRRYGEIGADILFPASAKLDEIVATLHTDEASAEALEQARIEAGEALFGIDFDDSTLPLEAPIIHAINYDKGCYIGQEVISRATFRGGVHWRFAGLAYNAEMPLEAGSEILAGERGKPSVRVRSGAYSPKLGRMLSLAYVHESLPPGSSLELPDGTKAEIIEMPFALGSAERPLARPAKIE